MAVLRKTESRLPEIFPEAVEGGGTTYFNAQNAALLGYNQFDPGLCLVSYLPSVIRSTGVTGNLQNHYVVFVDDEPGTEMEFHWSVNSFLETEEELEEGEEPDYEEVAWSANEKTGEALFTLDLLKQGLNPAEVAKLKKVVVTCAVYKDDISIGMLRLRHRIADPFEDIAALYEDDGDSIAKGGNQRTTYIAADIWRGYFSTPLTWYGKHTDEPPGDPPAMPSTEWDGEGDRLPLNHPLAVLYGALLKAGRKRYFPRFNQSYYNDINEDKLDLYLVTAKNSVGPSALTPHFAAVAIDKTPWTRIGGAVKERNLFDSFSSLSEGEKIDLYNLARFPKSSASLGAKLLDKLLEEADNNNYDQFLGSSGDKTTWKSDQEAALKDDKFVKSLIFEYINGPQEDIGGLEYLLNSLRFKKALKKTHLHDWSAYVTTILDYEQEAKESLGRIEEAFFARRKVTHHADGTKTVEFVKIENDDKTKQSTRLGREEYVVIKTKNLEGKKLKFSVVTGNEVLTGVTGEVLDLIQWKTKVMEPVGPGGEQKEVRTQLLKSEFTAIVDDDDYLQDEFGEDFDNREDLADLAIAKVGFRRIAKDSDKEDVWAAWQTKLAAASPEKPATLQLEVWMEDETPGALVNFGPEGGEDVPLLAETGFRFLNEEDADKHFRIYPMQPKEDAPRVVKSYFASKMVVGTTVSFDEIPTGPAAGEDGSWILGREVYVVVETENLERADHLKVYIQSGDGHLAGDPGDPLILQDRITADPRPHARQFFKLPVISDNPAAPGTLRGDDDLKTRIAPVANPYTNMAADFTNKLAVFRIKLRPHSGRAAFDAWSAAIDGTDDKNSFLNIRVQVSEQESDAEDAEPVYVYYGETRDHEEAGCGSSEVFKLHYDRKFQDKPAKGAKADAGKELSLVIGDGFSVWNREFYESYDYRNRFSNLVAGGRAEPRGGPDFDGNGYRPIAHIRNNFSPNPADVAQTRISYFFINQNDVAIPVYVGDRFTIQAMARGGGVANWPVGEVAVRVVDFIPRLPEGNADRNIAIRETRYYADGDVYSFGRIWSNRRGVFDDTFVRYAQGVGNAELVYVEAFRVAAHGTTLDFTWQDTFRTCFNPHVFAGLIGALGQTGHAIVSEGSSFNDGTCYPSVSHNNGASVDTNYFAPNASQQEFIDSMFHFGFNTHIVGCFMRFDHAGVDCGVDPNTGLPIEGIHGTHLHSGVFQEDFLDQLF